MINIENLTQLNGSTQQSRFIDDDDDAMLELESVKMLFGVLTSVS